MKSVPVCFGVFIVFLVVCIPRTSAQSDSTCTKAYRILYQYALDLEQQNQVYSDGLKGISSSLYELLESSSDSSTWDIIDQGLTRLGTLDSSLQATNMNFASHIEDMRTRNQTLDSLNAEFESQIRSIKKLNKGRLILVGGIGFLLGTASHRVFIRPGS